MAAGNWITSAGLGDANITVSARTIMVALNQADLNMGAIGHPVFRQMLATDTGFGQLLGALGLGLSFADLGQGKLAAVAEGTEATATNFNTTNVAVTPARKAYARKVGDWAASLQEPLLRGEISPSQEALITWEALRLWANQYVDMVVAHATSATNAIGTTAVALTWGALRDGIIDHKYRGNAGGPLLGMLTETGAKQLSADALSLGGAAGFDPQLQGFQAGNLASSGAWLGSYMGVDFMLNAELDASGGDDYGILLSPGAIHTKHQRVPLPNNADRIVDGGFFTVEARRPGGGINTYETVSHNGSAIAEQGRFAALQHVS